MAVGALTYFYKRLGSRYPLAFMAVELQTALVIVGGTLALFTFYFDGDTHEYLSVLGIALVLTELAILASLVADQARRSTRSRAWIAGKRDERSTQDAWSAAINLPVLLLRRDLPIPVLISVIPICVDRDRDPRPLGLGGLPAARRRGGRDGLLGDPPLPRGRGRDAPGAARDQLEPLAAPADRLLGGLAAHPAAGRAAADQPDHRPRRRRAHLRRRRRSATSASTCWSRCWSRRRSRSSSR